MSVTIIGSGVIGLFSALVLTDAGYKVTIIAREKAGDVEAFLEDIKPLKVKLHKSIILKLTTLKKKKS